jgi:hypothetical protein
MGARIESLSIPGIHPNGKWRWLLAGFIALSFAAGAASYLALRGGSEQANAPAQNRIAQPVAPAISTRANLTGHSLVYFTGGGSSPQLAGRGRAPSLAEFRGVDVIGISGTGPGLTEIAGNDSAKSQPSDTCRRVSRGPC